LVEANFDENFDTNGRRTRALKLPYPKYYVFAHFTRFLRPGFEVLKSTDPNILGAYSPERQVLVFVILNASELPVTKNFEVPSFSTPEKWASAVFSEPAKEQFMKKRPLMVTESSSGEMALNISLPPGSVCSVVIQQVSQSSVDKRGVSAAMVQDMSVHAGRACAYDRLFGATDTRTDLAWARAEHAWSCAESALESVVSDVAQRGRQLDNLKRIITSGAWSAANECKLGANNPTVKQNWHSFYTYKKDFGMTDDITWVMYYATRAAAHDIFLGEGNDVSNHAKALAATHMSQLGGPSAIIMPVTRSFWQMST